MSQLKPYPKYKDSGIEWVGEIPEHWEVTKLKFVSEVIMGQSPNSNLINDKKIGIPFLQGNREFKDVYPIEKLYCKEKLKTSRMNDILLSVRAPVGAMNWSDKSYVIGRGLCAITNTSIDKNYLWYLLSHIKVELFSKMTGSTFEAVTVKDVRELKVLLPTGEEQKQIARFLDKKTSEFDALIADKERLIELLEEKRQAVITETVTKGLDPDVKMKASGIEWIGEIPEHWEVTKIKYQSELNMKSLSDKTNPGQEITYIDIGSVDSNGNIIEKETMKFKEAPSRARRIVKEGDTIVSTVRTYLQAITMIDQTTSGCIVSTGFAVLSPKKSVVDEYFGLYFRSTPVLDRIISISKGINYPAINSSDLAQLEFIYPPYNEQEKIVKRINKKLKEMEIITSKIENQIQKLKEYRESLIYEAVTGKIDVRDYDVERSMCHGH